MGQEFLLGEHLWLVLHHSQASSILVFDLLQDHEREKMVIRLHYKVPAAGDSKGHCRRLKGSFLRQSLSN